jgi:hypothetical protein
MLLASVGYKVGSSTSTNTISLVNSGGVGDLTGAGLNFHVGSAQSQTLFGDNIGATASLGTGNACPICGIGVFPQTIDNVNANKPGYVSTTFSYYIDLPVAYTTSWSNFHFLDYTGPTTNPNIKSATFDDSTATFRWDSTGAVIGQYRWQVTLNAAGFHDTTTLVVRVTQVPEPSAFALMVGMVFLSTVCRNREAGSANNGSKAA